ncbi:MAG: hypothetical protein UIM53_03900 [Acutalibacteraceae bacterium]|nr:hypothetical protein [Acutalibacteraceae bacterium]
MSDIKYLGVQGLEELIILTQNALAKKADVLQFDAMPDPTKYIGKIVQYVGVSDISFTRSHFYYSNGTKWVEENTSGEQTPKIEMVTALPSWVDADPQALYILKNAADITMNFYVKNPSVNDAWFTVEKSISFAVVASLPQWADADPSIVYFKADDNGLVGYIKNIYTVDAWYTFGEKPQITIDTAISATSTNPLQNKAIFTEVQSLRVQANAILTASQDADKKLRDDIDANQTEIDANQTEIAAIKQNLINTYATQRYVENQNLLSDSEVIRIPIDASAPARMEYDGYVTVVLGKGTPSIHLYVNGTNVGYAEENNDRGTAITVFVAKNDDVYLLYPRDVQGYETGYVARGRFYKLRDYTNRPPKA